MKNFEKYGDEYIKALKLNDRCSFAQKYVIKDWCAGLDCGECHKRLGEWFEKEYKEPQIDWSKVPVDTPVICTGFHDKKHHRHFSRVYNNEPYAFFEGRTSWTTSRFNDSTWLKMELARPEDIEKYSIQ